MPPPPRTTLDPDGYYQRLGLEPGASRSAIVTAFRAKARLLHPDVPNTGDASAFVAMKQAYDVLSNPDRRAAYDRAARDSAAPDRGGQDRVAYGRWGQTRDKRAEAPDPAGPEVVNPRRSTHPFPPAARRPPRSFDVPIGVWVGMAAFLCLCIYQVLAHLQSLPAPARDTIRPNAATVAPLSASAHDAILYGATPIRLAGTPNFYVQPAATPAVLWRLDAGRNGLVPVGELPPFSSVQAVRLIREFGMVEVLVNEQGTGLISADHLIPGSATAARQAYCSYNAGPTPYDGELLERHGSGSATLEVENRALQPAVLKLRDETGAVAVSVFLGPGGQAMVDGVPDGVYHSEFAIGELWSRACGLFAAGMRAKRMEAVLRVPGDSHLVLAPDAREPAAADLPDQAFEQK